MKRQELIARTRGSLEKIAHDLLNVRRPDIGDYTQTAEELVTATEARGDREKRVADLLLAFANPFFPPGMVRSFPAVSIARNYIADIDRLRAEK